MCVCVLLGFRSAVWHKKQDASKSLPNGLYIVTGACENNLELHMAVCSLRLRASGGRDPRRV